MTLEQLRIFVGVAEREHVTQAAKALNITQSAASAAIAGLETQFGVALFNRVGRRIELTEAGRMFLEEARSVLRRSAAAAQTMADYRGLTRGSLRLTASQTIAAYWLPERLAAFHKQYPQIELEVTSANTDAAAALVHVGDAELGFIEGKIDDPSLAVWPVATDRLVLVGGTKNETIDTQWLADAPWVVREAGSGTRSSAEEALRAAGIAPEARNIVLTLPSNEAVLHAVRCGIGYALLSTLVVTTSVEAGQLLVQRFPAPTRKFFAVRQKERYRGRAADAFIDMLKTFESPSEGAPHTFV